MSKSSIRRIVKLRESIENYNKAYYEDSAPLITDAAYDALLRELVNLETQYPEFTNQNSPTNKIGSTPSTRFAKVTHTRKMQSLDNVFSEEELGAWNTRIERLSGQTIDSYVCEQKIDGLAVSIIYKNGEYVLGATRGDGIIGEDVTANIATISSIPKKLSIPNPPIHLEVRGEVYISLDAFDKLNKTSEGKTYANPRNCASGALRQKDPTITASRNLSFWAYQIGEIDGGPDIFSQKEALDFLDTCGFPVNSLIERVDSIYGVINYYNKTLENRNKLPYDIDGVVVKVDSYIEQEKLGSSSRAPRWAIAIKFPANEQQTVLKDIKVSVGKSGQITPFAVLEPVLVDGSTISLATLHNEDQVKIKDLRVGDTVVVRKAGDVIPEVTRPILELRPKNAQPWVFPSICPSCGGTLVKNTGDAAIYCVNTNCKAQIIEKITYFASRPAMNIEGLGGRRVQQFVEAGLLQDVGDIYSLTTDKLLSIEGFGERSAQMLISAIEDSKNNSLEKLLNGLTIKHMGEGGSKRISKAFGSIDSIIGASIEELASVPDVGTITAEAIYNYFHSDEARDIIAKLRQAGIKFDTEKKEVNNVQTLTGKTIVVSGTLTNYSREGAEEAIEACGGKAGSSISKNTYVLILGNKPGTSKITKAENLNIPIIEGDEAFSKLLETGQI